MVRVGTSATAEWLHANAMPQGEDMRRSAPAPHCLSFCRRRPSTASATEIEVSPTTRRFGRCSTTPRDLFIVVHLKRGTLWDAHDCASGRVIEIRPDESLAGTSSLSRLGAMLDFTSDRAVAMRRQGYHDAERALATIRDVVLSIGSLRQAQDTILDSLETLDETASNKNNSGLQIPRTAE
jgi:hypothetical protein